MAGPLLSKTFMLHVAASAHLSGVFILAAIVLHQTPAQAWPRFLYRFQDRTPQRRERRTVSSS